MALCTQYMELTPKERTEYIGKLLHSVQSSNELFMAGKRLIDKGERLGLYEGITINPAPIQTGNETRNDNN